MSSCHTLLISVVFVIAQSILMKCLTLCHTGVVAYIPVISTSVPSDIVRALMFEGVPQLFIPLGIAQFVDLMGDKSGLLD